MRISDWSSDVCSSDLFVLERADGRHRDDVGDPGPLEGVDVGPVVDVGRAVAVAAAVARQEHQPLAVHLAEQQLVRRLTEARRHGLPARVLQTVDLVRSEEHTSELQSLMRISYAVFCLKKKKNNNQN